MEDEINKLVKDAEFLSEDGTVYSMFSQQRNNGNPIHCNICGLLVPNIRDVIKHVTTLGHQLRLCDVRLAITTHLRDANECDGLLASQPKTILENLDEDETPPGCEELLYPFELEPIIASSLKTHSNSALIGLEYIVEVHPDMNCTAHTRAFYICVLCEKRCDILDNIVKHIESSAHRLSYLRKYFPRAYSLFLQADPCLENWTAEIHEYMEAIICRIESLKGRLHVFPCYRTRWDVQCQHLRTEINCGIHLRETPDLFYYDISAPFTAPEFEIRAKNVNLDDSYGPQSDSMLANGAKKTNAGKIDLFKNDITRLEQEAVILLSDDSLSEADCERVGENTVVIPTSQNLSKPGSSGTVSSKILKKRLWPINQLSQSVSVNHEEDITTEQSIYHSVSDDDIIVEKEIFGKEIAQKSNSPQRPELCSTPRSRSRSRSPKRSGFNSRGCNTASKSRSRSPKRMCSRFRSKGRDTASKSQSPSRSQKQRSRFSSSRQQPPKHREQHRYPSSIEGVRNSTGFEHLGNQRDGKRGSVSPMRTQKQGKNNRNESRMWKKFEKELNSFKEKLLRKHKIYKERPEDHPLYADEWKTFWKRRCAELEKEGKNPISYDMKPDWFEFWFSRMKKLNKKEIKTKKMELEKKYGLFDTETYHDNRVVEKETTESLKHREPVRFGWKNHLTKAEVTLCPAQNLEAVRNQTKNLPHAKDAPLPTELLPVVISSPNAYSFEELRVFQNPKPICHVVGNTSQIPKDAPLSSDPNLLQVLRMLVALEDSLGSLGPSITNLLTRALSAERCEIGSSSKLLKDDSTCIDLLDTSKEKLKGLLLAGILDGVKGTAASQAVEYVTRFLEQSSNTSHSCTPMDGPVGFNMASLINNLQAAGLLHSTQSTPSLPSAIGSSSVAEVKDKDSSANNLCESRFEKCDRFTGEELKTLIVNFRTLTESQKRDLVKYLHKIEETFPEKDMAVSPSSSSSSLPSSSSPLSKKYRQYQSFKVNNPVAPALPSSKTRYPTILEMTGLSCVDLKNHGIPLDELDSPFISRQVDSRLCSNNAGISLPIANHLPNPSRLSASLQSYLVQPLQKAPHLGTLQWGGASVQQNSFRHNFMEEQPTDRDEVYLVESIPHQQHSLSPSQQCNGSFCYQQLDPRRNRMHQRYDKTSPPNPLYLSQKSQDPVIIPTSPISQGISQRNDILELSDPWKFNNSSKTSSPLKGNGNRYW